MKHIVKENINEGYDIEQARIWTEKTTCEVCGEEKICLLMDGSDHEFFNGSICEQCAVAAFNVPTQSKGTEPVCWPAESREEVLKGNAP